MSRARVDEWQRAKRNADQRTTHRLHVAQVEWPVLMVRLRLVSTNSHEIAYFAAITTVKKRWSRRFALRNLVEQREREFESLNPPTN